MLVYNKLNLLNTQPGTEFTCNIIAVYLNKNMRLNFLYVRLHFIQRKTSTITSSQWVCGFMSFSKYALYISSFWGEFSPYMHIQKHCWVDHVLTCQIATNIRQCTELYPQLGGHSSDQPCTWVLWRMMSAKSILEWSKTRHMLHTNDKLLSKLANYCSTNFISNTIFIHVQCDYICNANQYF